MTIDESAVENLTAKTAEAADVEGPADKRLAALHRALATLTEIAEAPRDDRIEALFKKVDVDRETSERFASFGVDRQIAQRDAVAGYAAAVAAAATVKSTIEQPVATGRDTKIVQPSAAVATA